MPLGGWELAVVIMLALVIFYGKRMPEIGRNLGKSIVEFKKGLTSPAEESNEKPSGNSTSPTPPAQSEQGTGKTS
ncbi:MAG: twin-arginine translocase TatA/TatE family subunit [Phycisphaerae bacterium]|nr:twin-arginine translocase TatA/TatE family subunit [Phycisphaerae bacterium]